MANGITRDDVLRWIFKHPDRVAAVCPFAEPAQIEAALRDALAALSRTCGAYTLRTTCCMLPAGHGERWHEDALARQWPVSPVGATRDNR